MKVACSLRLLGGALLSVLVAASAFAGQEPGGPKGGDRTQARLEELKTRLALTDAQVPQVEAILKEAAEEGRRDREANPGDRQELGKRARERMQKVDAKIEALLTDDQKAKYEELKNERRQHYGGRHGQPH
jgi:protein CpxP